MNYGLFRVASASPKIKVADPEFNKNQIIELISKADEENVKLLITPELSITGYTCGDLFFSSALQDAADKALEEILKFTIGKKLAVVVGMPIAYQNKLYNCAIVIFNGKVAKIVPKTHLANYNEFYEKRWFDTLEKSVYIPKYDATMDANTIICLGDNVRLGIELCEDLWVTNPPSSKLADEGANIIANLSASDEYVSKAEYRRNLVIGQSARCICSYVYAGASVYESTTDLVFSGATMITENGTVLSEGERFSRDNVMIISDVDVEKLNTLRAKNMSFGNSVNYDVLDIAELSEDKRGIVNKTNDLKYRFVDPHPFVPADDQSRKERCREIFTIQAAGLAKRVEHVGSNGVVVGISGGLDSTLALLVCSRAMQMLGKDNSSILGVTMPGFGTTDRTYNNAVALMKSLGVEIKEISIKNACNQHMKDIGHNPNEKDITYENTQARERTQILFDLANKHGKLLVGTGDLSELAMGWCTYNGDHMSMYGVNASVPKTLVRYLVEYVADTSENKETSKILKDVLDTPVSPELLPPDKNGNIAQKTEDNIGPYELHDFFLYNFVRFGYSRRKLIRFGLRAFNGEYDRETLEKWTKVFFERFFASQFKRSCIPDSPKVGSVSLSPRGDWRMPSDASFDAFTALI